MADHWFHPATGDRAGAKCVNGSRFFTGHLLTHDPARCQACGAIDRLAAANAILATYSPRSRLESAKGLYFCWADHKDESRRLKWVPQTRGSDYPSISYKVPFGGTCTVATMELTRWVRGLPVRPLGMWAYFCSKIVGMNGKALELATAFGWPKQVPCVMCGQLLGGDVGYDHYDHDELKQPGPGCWYGEGCKTPNKGGEA